jgi:hypothetical protein
VKIRVTIDPQTKQLYTRGDLAGRTQSLTDIIGISLFVMFVGIWWEKAALFYLVIPVYLLYALITKCLPFLMMN